MKGPCQSRPEYGRVLVNSLSYRSNVRLTSACGMCSRCWFTAWTSTDHITSRMLSCPTKVGVSMSPDDTHRRWLSPSISKLSAKPLENHEPVRLTKLDEVLAGAPESQAIATLCPKSSLWSTMSKQDAVLPRMTLFSR